VHVHKREAGGAHANRCPAGYTLWCLSAAGSRFGGEDRQIFVREGITMLGYRGLALLIGLVSCVSVAVGEEPFRDLSFAEACAAAKEEDKVVLIDFYTTWCGPCKMMDKTTWRNRRVRRWLKKKTVALKIDAEAERGLAKKYSVEAYPTVLLLKPDGTEIDRLVGSREAEVFLSETEDALAGKDSLARAKEKIEGEKKNDPMERMKYAAVLAQKGKYEEGLKEYLWCFDHGNENNVGFYGVRLSFLLGDIVRLGGKYPPALEALRERRDAAEKALLAGAGKKGKREASGLLGFLRKPALDPVFENAMVLAAINRELGEDENTLVVYDKLAAEGKATEAARRAMFRTVLDQLLQARRYDDVLAGADVSREMNSRIEAYKVSAALSSGRKHDTGDFMKVQVAIEGGKFYEALLGVGLADKARRLANKLIAFDERGRTYATLIEHAVRAGAYDEARKLVRRARISLPDEELPTVRQAAGRIPAGGRVGKGGRGTD